jgi:hypothetical protein
MVISIISLEVRRMKNWEQREIPVVFVHNILKESVQKKEEDQENVAHINSSDSWRKLFVLQQMFRNYLLGKVSLAPERRSCASI